MRTTVLIITATVAGCWLGACSRPADHARSEDSRQITLPVGAAPAEAVASDLEAGRPLKAAPPAPRSQQARNPTVGQSGGAAPAVEAAAAPVLHLAATSVEEPVRTLDLVPLPPAVSNEPAPPLSDGPMSSLGDGVHPMGHSLGGGRGPTIIIRGGMGGIDDKCDLRPRIGRLAGGYGGAINRLAPPMGGGRIH